VYTLSGGFIWINLFIAPMLIGAPICISLFCKHPISDQLLKQVPVAVDKVPYLMMLGMVFMQFVCNIVCVMYIAAFRQGGYDNNTPREAQPKFLENHKFAARMKAAHFNTLEQIPIFATACFTAILLKLDPVLTAKLALLHNLSRVVYIVTYGLNIDIVRTFVFVVGFFSCIFMSAMAIFPGFSLDATIAPMLAALPIKLEL